MKKITTSPRQQESLLPSDYVTFFQTQDFEKNTPGTILADFEMLLELIGKEGMPVTSSHFFLLKQLSIINQKMVQPIELANNIRPVQKSYPHINGLYLLLRATGISFISFQDKKPILMLNEQDLTLWFNLTRTERYFELLKIWWIHATEDIIGNQDTRLTAIFKVILFFEEIRKNGNTIYQKTNDAENLRYHPGLHNIALMELFGLLKIKIMDYPLSKNWSPAEINLTDWGKILLGSYVNYIRTINPDLSPLGLYEFHNDEINYLQRFEQWMQSLSSYLPIGQQKLKVADPVFQPGTYVLKISLGRGCWRRIAIPGNESFDVLANMILDSVNFDRDHFYRFSYKDKYNRIVKINHPELEDYATRSTDQVRVGEVSLSPGMHVNFLFDFGDHWQFDILVESINTYESTAKRAILEKHGKSPKQYN